jgi:hypothetical protein
MKLYLAAYNDGAEIIRFANNIKEMKSFAEEYGGICSVWAVDKSDYETVAMMFDVELSEIERV